MVEHGTLRRNRRLVAVSSDVERHKARTPRPDGSYTITTGERDAVAGWEYAFHQGLHLPPSPPVVQWRESVMAYAKAKGVRVSFTMTDPYHSPTGETTVSWREETRHG